MALRFAQGVVQWLAADAATTVYTVSGLPFAPTAIVFSWQGLGSATDLVSETTDSRNGIGLTTGTGAQRCAVTFEQDAAATSVCSVAYLTDCIAATLTSAPAVDGKLKLNSLTSDGFTLIVDDQAPVNLTISYWAWGGTSVAVIGDFAEPAATGNQDYTATGLAAVDNDDQVVIFIGSQVTGLDAPERNTSTLMLGWATGGAAAENCIISSFATDAQATTDAHCYVQDGECLFAPGPTEAQLTQFNTNGFRLNWIARSLTNRRYGFLAMKGGKWRAGSYTINAQTVGNTATVSGLPFPPIGVCGMTVGDSLAAPGVLHDHAIMTLGTGTSPSSRGSQGYFSLNGQADATIGIAVDYDELLAAPDTGGVLFRATDLDAINNDGFRVIVDVAQAGEPTNEWQGYLAFGAGTRFFLLT